MNGHRQTLRGYLYEQADFIRLIWYVTLHDLRSHRKGEVCPRCTEDE